MSSPYLIASVCSPVDAGKMSGRYVETTFDADGKLITCFDGTLLVHCNQLICINLTSSPLIILPTGKPQPVIRSLRLLALEGEIYLYSFGFCAYDVHI